MPRHERPFISYVRYQKFPISFWNDHKFLKLGAQGRDLFRYIWDGPHCNTLGLYILKDGYAYSDLGLRPERFDQLMADLVNALFIEYDPEFSVVFVHDFLAHNPLTMSNQIKGAVRTIQSLPPTKLFSNLRRSIESMRQTSAMYEILNFLPKGENNKLHYNAHSEEHLNEHSKALSNAHCNEEGIGIGIGDGGVGEGKNGIPPEARKFIDGLKKGGRHV